MYTLVSLVHLFSTIYSVFCDDACNVLYTQLCELSFHKTRHLRNPYNENLPVKVSIILMIFPVKLTLHNWFSFIVLWVLVILNPKTSVEFMRGNWKCIDQSLRPCLFDRIIVPG